MVSLESGKSPLQRLVLFIICLAVAGSIVAGMYCVAVNQQQKTPAPANFGSGDDTANCRQSCFTQFCFAYVPGQSGCNDGYAGCLARCK